MRKLRAAYTGAAEGRGGRGGRRSGRRGRRYKTGAHDGDLAPIGGCKYVNFAVYVRRTRNTEDSGEKSQLERVAPLLLSLSLTLSLSLSFYPPRILYDFLLASLRRGFRLPRQRYRASGRFRASLRYSPALVLALISPQDRRWLRGIGISPSLDDRCI